MKKYTYKAIHYSDNSMMADDNMTDSMNKMSRQGWEVFKIIQTPSNAELSHYPTEEACLTDGDSFSIKVRTWIWYRK